jgi:hypothetical protein
LIQHEVDDPAEPALVVEQVLRRFGRCCPREVPEPACQYRRIHIKNVERISREPISKPTNAKGVIGGGDPCRHANIQCQDVEREALTEDSNGARNRAVMHSGRVARPLRRSPGDGRAEVQIRASSA